MTYEYDYLVIGYGIDGMRFAFKVAAHGGVALVCTTSLDEANRVLAHGGVPSVTDLSVDSCAPSMQDPIHAVA